jgi:hypothetical protein
MSSDQMTYPPSGDEKLRRLREGQPLLFPERCENEDDEAKLARTIQACWIAELADRQTRQLSVSIEIRNAIVVGTLDVQYREFEYEMLLENCDFEGDVLINDCLFLRSVQFRGSHFLRDANFNDTTFKRSADFKSVRIQGIASFMRTTFGDTAWFNDTQFRKNAYFLRTRFERDADFYDAIFQEFVGFQAAEGKASINLIGADFISGVGFNDARFRALRFGMTSISGTGFDHHAKFPEDGGVYLDGLTYGVLDGDWEYIFDHQNTPSPQPYPELQRFLRAGGRDTEADRAYLKQRRIEGKRIRLSERPVAWIWDRLFYVLAGYGVRVWPLVLLVLFLWVYGGHVYAKVGALVAISPQGPDTCGKATLTRTSLAVSFRVLTKLDLPVASCWAPSNKSFEIKLGKHTRTMTYSEYASIQMICAWILLPFVLATLAERVRRRPR